MAKPLAPSAPSCNRPTRWLLKHRIEQAPAPGARESETEHHPGRQVVCLTGVRRPLPHRPMFIVLLTLFGALPMYRIVAGKSPNRQGSIAMLEGDTAPVTHEVLREAEPEASRRQMIHVGGR